MENIKNIALLVPVLNAGSRWKTWLLSLDSQTIIPSYLVAIDSSSLDETVSIAKSFNFTIHSISRSEFNHGATRQLGVDLVPEADIIIFMTQDAFLASHDSIRYILSSFADPRVGAVCGRQLPRKEASPIAAHARLFNYPASSSVKSKVDIPTLGIKAAFLSNSFAAYRRTALLEVGGFPSDVIFGEDTYIAAKMLGAGWKIAYAADAICHHSHNYSMKEEFERYFDIGVFHSREKWFVESLGKAEGEGKRFVLSELRYLAKNAPWLIPSSLIRTGLKLIGYKLGQREAMLPLWIKRKLSMNKGYWKNA